jgi:FAD/FMN-containing dehydrogenase
MSWAWFARPEPQGSGSACGAGHSVPATIAGSGDTVLVLDRLRHRHFDEATGEVTAGAGVRFGPDRADPRQADGTALCPWLAARGRALSNLGGILHQTVAGFLLTGSGGGSTRYDLAASVMGLRFVDGTGQVHGLRRGTDDDLLDAVLVSVGACGVITDVTFRTEPAFDVAGTETVLPDRGGSLDLFADGPTGPTAFFERTDYARVLWWPQRTVRRIVAWAARRVPADDAEPTRPYHPMPPVFGSTVPAQMAAGAVLWGIVHWRRPVRLLGEPVARMVEPLATRVEGMVYRAFVQGDPQRPHRFRGPSWTILPQDALMDERWMPTTFTEVFVPLDRAAEALRRLDAAFDADPAAAGRFAIELYAAPPSTAWLHPAYGRPSLRINVFWLTHATDDPRDAFLPRIWAALADCGPRLHWGKLFPHEPATMVAGRYPRHRDFLAARARLDPDGVFLSAWLAVTLGASTETVHPVASLPDTRMPRPRLHWPLVFGLQPSDSTLLDHADFIYDLERVVASSPEDALLAFFDDSEGRGAPGLLGFTWHSPMGQLDDAVIDEAFVFMTLRMRTVSYEPGQRLVLSVDRSSLPLGRQLCQVMEVTPRAGGCHIRWRVAVRYVPGLAFAAPALVPLFRTLFTKVLDSIEAKFRPRT